MPQLACPIREGFYWMWAKDDPHRPLLMRAYRKGIVGKTLDKCPMHFFHHSKHPGVSGDWNNTVAVNHINKVEFIGEGLRSHQMPTQDGYYWITGADGTRSIVNAKEYQIGVPNEHGFQETEWKAWVLGKSYQYGWLAIIEAYQLVRCDFISPADEDFYATRL